MSEVDNIDLTVAITLEMAKMSHAEKVAYLNDRGIEVVNEGDLDQMVFANLMQDAQVA